MKRTLFLALSTAIALTARLSGQDFPLSSAADFSIPESPAFTVLGVTPQDVTRPGSPSTLAASLLRAVADNGELQNGVAVDFAPYMIYRGRNLTLGRYQQSNGLLRFAARAKVSFGTTRADDADKTDRVALGMHFTMFDYGDPRRDNELVTCFNNALSPALEALEPVVVAGDTTSTDLDDRKIRICREDSAKRNWNRSSWIVAGAPAWKRTTTNDKGFQSNGGGIWTSIAWGFEPFRGSWLGKHAQLIGHWRKRFDEDVTKDSITTEHDKTLYGVRLRLGTARMSGSIELTESEDESASSSSKIRRLLAGVDQTLTPNLSLQLSFGRERVEDGDSRPVIRSGFHWKFKTN